MSVHSNSGANDRFRVIYERGMSVCIQISARLLGGLDPDPSIPLLLNDLRACMEKLNNEHYLRKLHDPEMDNTFDTQLASKISPKSQDNSIRTDEIESLKESFETMAQHSSERASEVAALRKQIGELKDQLRFAHQNMARLEAAHQAETFKAESAEIKRLESELRRLQETPPNMVRESDLLSVIAEMSTVDGAVRHLHGEIDLLKHTNAGLVAGMKQLDGDIEQLQDQLQAYKEEVGSLTA
eukprot:CAMPEP_0172167894 /NCGR_PEP_ID=MMETSP1050-20130122/9829_1 /TAXON_ID=233186 /ORGANISM="Cryptomonas curvata, Strain CCAP979/52" /LENGTH=240 /DNA_ID=CAMNT_0012838743 /DNA_START=76 /DNA_END=795 /DNA_ORIENTATION=-